MMKVQLVDEYLGFSHKRNDVSGNANYESKRFVGK